MSTVAEVRLWGRLIGAVSIDDGDPYAAFEYAPDFATSGIEVSPLVMPLSRDVYRFPELPRKTFHGLPGLLADSLPDRFGTALIEAWLATQGRHPSDFNAVERLCYTGRRGMGALEYHPVTGPRAQASHDVEIEALVRLASDVLSKRDSLVTSFGEREKEDALKEILRVGTSAGGARAKAVIAWNRKTGEVRSGQVSDKPGFEYWLLKLDGVTGSGDYELEDPRGYGRIEYAYSMMARAAGIRMQPASCSRRVAARTSSRNVSDRLDGGEKLHMADARFAGALRLQPGRCVRLRAGVPRDPHAGPRHGSDRRTVPTDGVQHPGAQPGRPRQEHRVLDGQDGTLVAFTRLRRDLRLQPGWCLDRATSDVDERQAR